MPTKKAHFMHARRVDSCLRTASAGLLVALASAAFVISRRLHGHRKPGAMRSSFHWRAIFRARTWSFMSSSTGSTGIARRGRRLPFTES